MRTFSAEDAARDWSKLAGEAMREPVRVQRSEGPDVVVLSAADYDRMRGATRQRLKASLLRLHTEVDSSDLSPAAIGALIDDAS